MNHEIYAAFSKRLSQICDEKGMPERGRQADLARLCDIKPSSVNKWFSATSLPDAGNLLKIADWANTTVDWLLYGRGNREVQYPIYDKSTQHVIQIMEKLDASDKYKAARMLDLLAEPEEIALNGTK